MVAFSNKDIEEMEEYLKSKAVTLELNHTYPVEARTVRMLMLVISLLKVDEHQNEGESGKVVPPPR